MFDFCGGKLRVCCACLSLTEFTKFTECSEEFYILNINQSLCDLCGLCERSFFQATLKDRQGKIRIRLSEQLHAVSAIIFPDDSSFLFIILIF